MFEDFFHEKMKLEEEHNNQKNMLQEELRLNEVIKEQLQQGQDKLRQELKELKRIIKIPRMHFKYLEKLEYDEIMGQMKELETTSHKKQPLKKHVR